jgi:hypothetical protein
LPSTPARRGFGDDPLDHARIQMATTTAAGNTGGVVHALHVLRTICPDSPHNVYQTR